MTKIKTTTKPAISSNVGGSLYLTEIDKLCEMKKLYRKTRHTHHPVDDAKGNAEALLSFKKLGLRVNLQ